MAFSDVLLCSRHFKCKLDNKKNKKLRSKFLLSIGEKWKCIAIWSNIQSLLANNILCKIQQQYIMKGRKLNFNNVVPISLSLALKMSNFLSTFIYIDECFFSNQTTSFERDNFIGPILNDVMYQLKIINTQSTTMYEKTE